MTGVARIAEAAAADVASLCALDVRLVARGRQDAIVRESVVAGTAFVAWDGATVAGYVTWDCGFFHRPFVRLLAVTPRYRRRGVGAALLRRVEEAVCDRTPAELFVSTEAVNAGMQALLERLDYAPSGTVDNVNEPGNAELIYYKRLR